MPDVVRFTELLFADQSLDELLIAAGRDELQLQEENVWTRLAAAAECLRKNERAQAVEMFSEIVANPKTETRILLWSWTALRGCDVRPKSEEAAAIKGVVIQVPMERGTDVLAAYADGTARYVNQSGKIIVWSLPDAHIGNIVCTLLARAKDLNTDAATASANRSGSGVVKVTVLTLSGNRSVEIPMQSLLSNPINQVMSAGAELMGNLIKRTEAMNRLMPPPRSNEGVRLRS